VPRGNGKPARGEHEFHNLKKVFVVKQRLFFLCGRRGRESCCAGLFAFVQVRGVADATRTVAAVNLRRDFGGKMEW
jgi:hypothetical protein